jgi:hypothetical protein
MLERIRFEREIASLREAAPEREYDFPVTWGEFGKALVRFAGIGHVPNAVSWFLQHSPTYLLIIQALDAKYLHFNSGQGLPTSWSTDWEPDADGVFTKGPHINRRMLSIELSSFGSFFQPFSNPENFLPFDVIFLQKPPSQSPDPTIPVTVKEWGEWIEMIAHESVHAWRHILGKRRAGKTAADRIRAGIDDEIATRKWEGKIVNELRNQFGNFRPYQPQTGSILPWAVERDIFPGQLRRSYLEHFVLSERLHEARRQLSDDDVKKYDNFVKQIDLSKRPLNSYLAASPQFVHPRGKKGEVSRFQQDYPNLLLALRVIDLRWQSVKSLVQEGDLYRDAELEKMRQEHAKAFFAGLATYTQVP